MARPRLGDSESKRLQMVITEDELGAIDDWQHANKISSRSDAIRRLVRIGLHATEALPHILETASKALDGQAYSLDIPDVLKKANPSLEGAAFDREISIAVWDAANNNFNKSFEAFEELLRLVASIGPLFSQVSAEDAIKFAEAIAQDEENKGRAAIHELLKPRLEVWREHRRHLLPTLEEMDDE